jgi:hypothetical protein
VVQYNEIGNDMLDRVENLRLNKLRTVNDSLKKIITSAKKVHEGIASKDLRHSTGLCPCALYRLVQTYLWHLS